jgi:hypothetical protein
VASVVGGLFGAAIATLSPEFVSGLLIPKGDGLTRHAAAVGAIWGIFLGAGAMVFVIGAAAVANWFRPRPKEKQE